MELFKFKTRRAKKVIPPFQEVYDLNPEAKGALVLGMYSVHVLLAHGEYEGNNTIVESRQSEVTLSADSGWFLPASVSVTNASFTYNASTGKVVLSNPTGNVLVEGVCDPSIGVSISDGSFTGDDRIVLGTGTASVTLSASAGYSLPSSITVVGADYTYDSSTGVVSLSNATGVVAITAHCVLTYTISVSVTNGSYSGDSSILLGGTASVTLSAGSGYVLPDSITVVGASYSYDSTSGVVSLNTPTGNVSITAVCPADVDAVLENNSWEKIRQVCEAGNASAYWAIGDTKSVIGGDTYSRPVMIVDMQGLYSKHVVFQFRYRTENNYVWDADNVNDYAASDMNVTHLVAGSACFNELVSNDLSAQLTNTTVKVAKGGTDGTLVDVTNKLFLPAEKEISASRTYSRTEEFDALTTFQWYVSHNTAEDRVIHKASAPTATSAQMWWERSPYGGNARDVCYVNSIGDLGNVGASYDSIGVAPCFAF